MENEFPISPLTVPSMKDRLPIDELEINSAIESLTQRAQAPQPTFELSDENAAMITHICAQFDGLPLAIEMASVRIKGKFERAVRLAAAITGLLTTLKFRLDRPERYLYDRSTIAMRRQLDQTRSALRGRGGNPYPSRRRWHMRRRKRIA